MVSAVSVAFFKFDAVSAMDMAVFEGIDTVRRGFRTAVRANASASDMAARGTASIVKQPFILYRDVSLFILNSCTPCRAMQAVELCTMKRHEWI